MDRVRSFWAWGFEESFPSLEARREIARRLESFFGKSLEPGTVPTLEAIDLPTSRYTPPFELRRFGTTDKRERAVHTRGRSYPDVIRGFIGDFASAPDWVFYPEHEDQLGLLYRFCESESIALVPFGGGTSVVGGVEAAPSSRFRGVASVDLGRMNRVLEVDTVSRAARIQAGATGTDIARGLSEHGLVLRHYPQSFELSTLGGWIATRSAGHHATLMTRIDHFVESMRMVTPAGVFETMRVPSSGAGPAPDRLALGSEGAFGIITEAWLRVEARPRWRASASVSFERFEDGVRAARSLAQSGLCPSNCRLLDGAEARLHAMRSDGRSVLLLAFESADHPLEPWMARALALTAECGGESKGPKYTDIGETMRGSARDEETWRAAFFEAPYMHSALVSLGILCDTFETACTWSRFDALHRGVVERVTDALHRTCGAGFVTSRLTHVYADGPAPYFTFVAPAPRGGEIEAWSAVKKAASDALLELGGTITHHHAVGRMHRPWWEKERSPLFGKVLEATKARLDPEGILNPGCLLAERR